MEAKRKAALEARQKASGAAAEKKAEADAKMLAEVEKQARWAQKVRPCLPSSPLRASRSDGQASATAGSSQISSSHSDGRCPDYADFICAGEERARGC